MTTMTALAIFGSERRIHVSVPASARDEDTKFRKRVSLLVDIENYSTKCVGVMTRLFLARFALCKEFQ
jgi:hypothetical protein